MGTAEARFTRHRMKLQLHRSCQLYLRFAQLLFNAPYNLAQDVHSNSYFKQARCLVSAGILAWVTICGYRAIAELIEVPMPFFTAVLYVNEVILCVCITVQTMVRGYGEAERYDQFLERILTVATAVPATEWAKAVLYLRVRLHWLGTTFTVIFSLGLLLDYLHFGSIGATLFSLGAYMLPNMLAAMSLAQYTAGTVLIYKLQQIVNRQLRTATRKQLRGQLQTTKHHYLQLDHCVQLITRSYNVLIVSNVFAGINVTSLQLLEIYQYLQANESKPIYMGYNILWIALQLGMLLMVLCPSDRTKREQTHFGTILFELSQCNEFTGDDVDQQIAHLRLLTLNQKRIVPTACGVLKLELSTLSSIFVALLSFMIILIQFDTSKLNKHGGAVTALDGLYSAKS
uniref:Gustatory receptor n=1 Tax=Anopheles epiroticus TaxID=199890 RepID=A0A182PHU1_9DIPT